MHVMAKLANCRPILYPLLELPGLAAGTLGVIVCWMQDILSAACMQRDCFRGTAASFRLCGKCDVYIGGLSKDAE